MRYFIVTYYRQPDGRTDEVVAMDTRVRDRHLYTASVILDFKKQQVLKASLDGTNIPRDWARIHDYYHQHYPEVIDQLNRLFRPESVSHTS